MEQIEEQERKWNSKRVAAVCDAKSKNDVLVWEKKFTKMKDFSNKVNIY